MEKNQFFDNPLMRTKITSANVKPKEMILGYFLGPFCAFISNAIFGAYLNRYYSDVLGWTDTAKFGIFSAVLPMVSVIFVILGNLLVGRLIDNTRTSQGKARPYMLLSAPLVTIAIALLFLTPQNGSPWGVTTYYRATAPATTGVFTSLEPETATLDEAEPNWKKSMTDYNVMIVTLARAAGENANYTPGEDGVNPEQDLNQADPLGLSDTERAIIDEAVNAKKENNGKLIVMLNNASAMEIEEIKNNTGADAILEVGLPGGYGFYGVADVLSGEVNPSGHLADTYAVDNSSSPAAQNYGNYEWTNADSAYSINSEIVEAEGIYTGYKYYETRYADTVLGQGNASDKTGSSNGKAWNYEDEVSYPFGYGLSYTTYSQTQESLDVNLEDNKVTAKETLKNTEDVAEKDVVQL